MLVGCDSISGVLQCWWGVIVLVGCDSIIMVGCGSVIVFVGCGSVSGVM